MDNIFFPPEFEYILPSNGHRYVLVVHRPASVNSFIILFDLKSSKIHLKIFSLKKSRRWSLIRRALYRWIHALPSSSADEGETHLSVIVSSSSDANNLVVLGWTKVTADNRDGLVGRIPRRPANPPSISLSEHLVSAIRLAHQVFYNRRLIFGVCGAAHRHFFTFSLGCIMVEILLAASTSSSSSSLFLSFELLLCVWWIDLYMKDEFHLPISHTFFSILRVVKEFMNKSCEKAKNVGLF